MTNSKSSKRAFVSSAIAVLLCVVMLIGTTFAWFTDTAKTGVNRIQAGTLDIELQMKDGQGNWIDAEGKTLDFKKSADAPEGEAVLWEPGCTYELPQLRVVNKGNLAVKFKVAVTGIQGDTGLGKVIDWTINGLALDTDLTLAPKAENATEYPSQVFTISAHMQESAGNEYQKQSIENIAITVLATQAAYEYDSKDDQYDAEAPLDFEPVATVADLKAAAEAGKNVMLTQDVTVEEVMTFDKPVTIDLNGNTLTTTANKPADSDIYAFVTKGSTTIKNGTFKGEGTARGIGVYGDLTMDHVTVDVNGLVGVACSAADSTYTITNSTIKGGYALCNFSNNVTVSVSDSVIEGRGVGIYHNGTNSGLDLTVNGTTINAGNEGSDATGVYISGSTTTKDKAGYQKATFTDCTIKGNAAVEVKYTDLTLNNCTAVATVDAANASYVQNNNGATTNGFAVVSTDNAVKGNTPKPEGTITINGGSYTGLVGLHNLPGMNTQFPDFVDTTYVINK